MHSYSIQCGEVAASPRLVRLGRKWFNNFMYYVYILRSEKTKRLYKGFTSDLKSRILEHNRGKTTSTKNGIPWKIIYYEAFENEKDARREELFLKSGKGRERIRYFLENSK